MSADAAKAVVRRNTEEVQSRENPTIQRTLVEPYALFANSHDGSACDHGRLPRVAIGVLEESGAS